MQAVILAAGQSTRTYPLTLTRPKPLIPVAGRPILQHTLEQLDGLVDEVIIVVGWKKEQIKAYLSGKTFPFSIRLVEQKEQKGTGHALQQAQPFLKGPFLTLPGDDLFFASDLQKLVKHEYAVLVKEVKDPEKFGVIEEQKGCIKAIHEKPTKPPSNLVNTGAMMLIPDMFSLSIKKTARGELELTDYLTQIAQTQSVKAVRATYWIPIGYPWHILEANAFLLKIMKPENNGTLEDDVNIKGPVTIGKGSLIRSGSYIEGPVRIGDNCTIGPNCFIRPSTSIGDDCVIGQGGEVKNSVIFNHTKISHVAVIGDSVIGENVRIGGGTMVCNVRHDRDEVKTMIQEKIVSTGCKRFGTVIGDHAKTGANSTILPGRKLWPQSRTAPGFVIENDVKT